MHPYGYFRVLALDFDGTLTSDGRTPSPHVLDSLRLARATGIRVLLVTGRILAELEAAWPGVAEAVDGIVAENGAVFAGTSTHRLLSVPVDRRLDTALTAAGVPFRRGESLLAAAVADEPAIVHAIRSLHLDCQTVANRTELMVLPQGVSKGTGLYRALGLLGLSFHNTIAVGDAENDESLLDRCELCVAVANAVQPLAEQADLVLEGDNGDGVARFVTGPLLAGARLVHSRRWQVWLGSTPTGEAVTMPSARVNVLLTGDTGTGKSYVAGMVAEQLIGQDYSILVIDPEGDHVGLGHLPGTLVVGGRAVAEPDETLRLLHHRYASVVVDLSGVDQEAAHRYERELLTRVEAHRRETGLPHWVVLDEADQLLGRGCPRLTALDPAARGYFLVTWQSGRLAPETVAALDLVVVVAPPHGDPDDDAVDLAAAVGGAPRAEVARLLAGVAPGQAVVARRDGTARLAAFSVAGRTTPHLRHRHKYESQPLDAEHCFHFRSSAPERTGAVAANLEEFAEALAACERRVLRHHCPRRDFSRWVADVFHDGPLARRIERAESAVGETSPGAVIDEARLDLLSAIQDRLVD